MNHDTNLKSEQCDVIDALKYDIRVDLCGNKVYYNKDGLVHREDGPAVEYAGGGKEWWIDGNRHRLDGPAIEWSDGDKEWYINGSRYTKERFNEYIKSRRI